MVDVSTLVSDIIAQKNFHYYPVDLNPEQASRRIDEFEKLLVTAMLGSQIPVSEIERTIQYLRATDFYTAPASTKYHENYTGGLLEHSIRVMNIALQLSRTPIFSNVPLSAIVFAALLHDLCKVDFYEESSRNVKNEKTGKWEKVPIWAIRRDRPMYLGHGEQSCIQLLKLAPSTDYRILEAIRWHMGLWQPSDQMAYGDACRTNPLVLLIATADHSSTSDWV